MLEPREGNGVGGRLWAEGLGLLQGPLAVGPPGGTRRRAGFDGRRSRWPSGCCQRRRWHVSGTSLRRAGRRGVHWGNDPKPYRDRQPEVPGFRAPDVAHPLKGVLTG